MNILVTGSDGQLGNELRLCAEGLPEWKFVFTDVAELDITDSEAVREMLRTHRIDAVVNCAAYTAVDKAESDREAAWQVNVIGPATLAAAAAETGATLVHISTDYVFDGLGSVPYKETDAVAPAGVYGATKLAGERAVAGSGCRSVVVRTAWLYSAFGNNFVKTMLRLGAERDEVRVVCDQRGTPTWAADLARAITVMLPKLIEEPRYGEVYHFTDEGQTTWDAFAARIMALAGLPCRVLPITTAEYPTAAARPPWSVLDKSKIRRDFGVATPPWEESLEKCISLIGKIK